MLCQLILGYRYNVWEGEEVMIMKIDSVVKSIVSPQPTGAKPAELGISESMKSQENALTKGSENLQDAINLGKTAEGTLNTVTYDLQRVRELSLQAQNGTYTESDKAIVQEEIGQLLSGVQDSLKNTEFNRIKLFDGGFEGNIQGGGENQGRMMKIENTSLETLGLEGFDITKGDTFEKVDSALSKIQDSRSAIGSQTNAYESAIQSNDIARENTLSARSRFDEDFSKQISELKRLQITDQYKIQLQKKQSESEQSKLSIFEV